MDYLNRVISTNKDTSKDISVIYSDEFSSYLSSKYGKISEIVGRLGDINE